MNVPSPATLAARGEYQYSSSTPTGPACGYCSYWSSTGGRVSIRHKSIGDIRHCASVADKRAGYANYAEANGEVA